MQYILCLLLLIHHEMFVSRSLPSNKSLHHNTVVIILTFHTMLVFTVRSCSPLSNIQTAIPVTGREGP
jgi:hypothetical protein